MRLTIIPVDNTVYVEGIAYAGIDMTWIPEIDGKQIHAVQWYGGHGEIEFVGPEENLKIRELGQFQKAFDLWNEKQKEEELLKRKQLEEEERLRKEEEERRNQFLETHIPAANTEDEEDEDEDLFYDIEELLKEI